MQIYGLQEERTVSLLASLQRELHTSIGDRKRN